MLTVVQSAQNLVLWEWLGAIRNVQTNTIWLHYIRKSGFRHKDGIILTGHCGCMAGHAGRSHTFRLKGTGTQSYRDRLSCKSMSTSSQMFFLNVLAAAAAFRVRFRSVVQCRNECALKAFLNLIPTRNRYLVPTFLLSSLFLNLKWNWVILFSHFANYYFHSKIFKRKLKQT